MNTTTTATPTTVTIPAGIIVRKYEETASRDHDVELVPGTYEVRAARSAEGRVTYLHAAIPAIARPHTRSTIEVGGVAYGWEERGGEAETYGWSAYPWEIDKLAARGYSFGYGGVQ